MNHKTSDIQSRLERLHQDYARQLPGRIGIIEAAWRELLGNPQSDRHQELARLCHTLAGSGASYGFEKVTEQARRIEQTLNEWPGDTTPDSGLTDNIEDALQQLRLLADQAPDRRLEKPVRDKPDTSVNRLVYILDETQNHGDELAGQIRDFGYTIELFDDSRLLQQQLEQRIPAAVIIIGLQAGQGTGLLDRYASLSRQVATLLITDNSSTEARLEAVRNGIQGYFLLPIDIIDLIDELDQYSHAKPEELCRILIVEDSRSTAELHAEYLREAGMEVRYISEPLEIMESISQFAPDLILMDFYLPGCNGREVSELVRQQDSNLGTPIVFLSSESDPTIQMSLLEHGDDFLTKPISADNLVAAVRSRTRRFRELRSMMLRDGLTGLYNHTSLIDILYRETKRAVRHGEQICYAMLDIDHFKSVNDNYGHGVGDRVIKSLSRLLRQRLRASDYIGRYGGEEFAVIMPNTSSDAAFRAIESIRQDFARLRHETGEGEIFCSFSAGIADNQETEDAGNLARAADTALYQAKQEGRNRIVLAPDTATE